MTSRFFAAFTDFTNAVTALPEAFIIVSGRTRTALSLPILPFVTSALLFPLKTNSSSPSLLATSSTAFLPALCRVFSYSFPGFPRPTITSAMVRILSRSEPVSIETCALQTVAYNARMSDTWKGLLKDLFTLVLLIVVVVIPIRMFVISPFVVDGDSMHPTFQNLDYLVIDELIYNFKSPERGDVIVFRYPGNPSVFS